MAWCERAIVRTNVSRGAHAALKDYLHFDPLNRLTSLRNTAFSITNSYDPFAPARLTRQTISFGACLNDHLYSYDLLDQLTSERLLVNTTQVWYNVYAYDGFGDVITARNEAVTYTGN